MTKNKGKKKRKLDYYLIDENIRNPVIHEQLRSIRTNLTFSGAKSKLKTMMVTSSQANEGKSTLSVNLALLFAMQGSKILIIDGDLRKPTMSKLFDHGSYAGLVNVLVNEIQLEDAIQSFHGIDVVTSGPVTPNPAELLSSVELRRLLEAAKEKYDLVIIDSPPVLAVTDAQILASLCDGIVLVIHSGKTKVDHVLKAKGILEKANGKILGTILNRTKVPKEMYYY